MEDRFSNGLQDSRKNVNFLGFLISLSDNFGEVVYQETPEDVGKNEMNTKKPSKSLISSCKDQERAA